MANTTFSELRRKEIINICDGARLGCICDLELDDCTGLISAIIVPGPMRFLGLFRGTEELVIPYCKIEKIGDDVILVRAEGL
ncbi:MAG: YlmC/YmxH family sporulation protein [Clostridiales bacterium]|nr:YlmC/YmxH family sporulation protein [Clostridiales bacterium]